MTKCCFDGLGRNNLLRNGPKNTKTLFVMVHPCDTHPDHGIPQHTHNKLTCRKLTTHYCLSYLVFHETVIYSRPKKLRIGAGLVGIKSTSAWTWWGWPRGWRNCCTVISPDSQGC
jgi:hypothetical protein